MAYQERGSGPPHFDGKNYQMWSKQMAVFLRGNGQILLDVMVDTGYVQLMNFLAEGSRDMFDANNKAVHTCFVLCVSLSSIGCTPSTWLVEFERC
jgi:5'(3')-deoxyribonucleotidase